MKVMIVGARGLAGSALMRVLPQHGHECVPVTRENYSEHVGSEVDVLVNANGNSAKYLAERDPAGEIDRSVASVMRTCEDFKAGIYLLLSSADVYAHQDDPSRNSESAPILVDEIRTYGVCKYMAECVVRNRHPESWILRLGGLLGPGLRKNPVFDLLTGSSLRVHPDTEFGYIHTEEVARITAHLLAEKPAGGTLNVSGSGLVSVRQLAEWAGRSLAAEESGAQPFRYDINNEQLRSFWEIPRSHDTAREFIKSWPAGAESRQA